MLDVSLSLSLSLSLSNIVSFLLHRAIEAIPRDEVAVLLSFELHSFFMLEKRHFVFKSATKKLNEHNERVEL
jgi:hypothetical protein